MNRHALVRQLRRPGLFLARAEWPVLAAAAAAVAFGWWMQWSIVGPGRTPSSHTIRVAAAAAAAAGAPLGPGPPRRGHALPLPRPAGGGPGGGAVP
ncbi:MAG: hypothetical protein H8E31_02010, partial [Planctomycetes bacterium]|nr:hypothetical protein [Planctomycetota bacterium]